MPIEDLIFSGGGGFLFGAVASYTIKKVIKLAAIIIGLFVVGLSYLSYRGWINVRRMEMENATRATLTNVAEQVGHALNNTASQFAAHSNYTRNFRFTNSSCIWVYAWTYVGIKERITSLVKTVLALKALEVSALTMSRLYLEYESSYDSDKKYCRRYKVYYSNQSMFCPCCGMALRKSPADRKGKKRLRLLRYILSEGMSNLNYKCNRNAPI